MGIYFCETEGCGGYFCSVDMSSRPHAPFCELYKEPTQEESPANAPAASDEPGSSN